MEKKTNNKKWYSNAIKSLSDQVYITFDLDCLDPSIMPAVGTPEPGGLGYYSVLEFIKELANKRRIIGFDIVELCPKKGMEHANFLAAKLCYKMMNYLAK